MTVLKDGNGNKIKMNMMKFKCIYALIAVVLLATACQDEEIIQPVNPGLQGAEITFGARAGFENSNPGSRTEYSGVHYTYNGAKFERIDWVKGDTVQVYSPQAGGTNPSHYTVIGFKDGDEAAGSTGKGEDYAALERIGESSLQWGNGEHTFYAMYPSTLMFSEGTEEYQNIKLEGTTMHAFIADEQVPASVTSDDAGNWVAAPNMKYAFMVAKDKASQTDNNGNVSLSFVPAVTAVQLKLVLPNNSSSTEKVNSLNIGTVRVEGTGIAGSYTADLGTWNPEKTTYPTYKAVSTTNYVEIPVWHDTNEDGVLDFIKIEPGHSLTFTVFLVPGGNISGLKVGISDVGISYQQKALGVEVVSNKKNVINGMQLPVSTTPVVIDYSKWMALLDANTTMKALSIPGTGGSFTKDYKGDNPDWYKQQSLSFEDQWKLGIRAFEIVSNRHNQSPATVDAATSLGTAAVKCNATAIDTLTVGGRLRELLKKVTTIVDDQEKPTETAVLILTYQPEGASPNRNATYYARNLRKLYNSLSETQRKQIIQYKPDLKMSAARGNVMIFCRINQKDETDNGSWDDAKAALDGTNITLINGCGTAKDRWGSRGYKVNGTQAWDIAHTSDEAKSVDYYLQQTGGVLSGGFSWPDWNNVSVPNAENGDLKFGFATNYSDVTCWYQEWARVVPPSLINSDYGWYQINGGSVFGGQVSAHKRWYESYSEKLAAAKKTFDMAISGEHSGYIFINSLCGYLVDESISASSDIFTGSWDFGTIYVMAGNIKGLADNINPDFYSYVLTTGMSDKPGPTGIVMMDYVSNDVNAGGAYLLPSVIIANNLKPGMSTGGSSSGTGSGTGSGGSGI